MIKSIVALFKTLGHAVRNPQYQLLALTTFLVVASGTIFYHYYEHWSWIDSIYFVFVALTTVGFGDFAPTTELSRFVTIGFVVFGVAWIGAFISLVVKGAQKRHQEKVAGEKSATP